MKSKLRFMAELASFHYTGAFRQSPLAKWHLTQAHLIEARHGYLVVPWLALALLAQANHVKVARDSSGRFLGQRGAKYDLPKRSKVPIPL